MYEKTSLDYKDGTLCVKYETNNYNEPVRNIMWWPISKCHRSDCEHLIGLDVRAVNIWTYGGRVDGFWCEWQLTNGGKTLPIASENIPIPCPKVRKGLQTRWKQGQWQKLLKTGWKNA